MELGRLEYVSAREVWKHEAHEFTPWLFANADRLAEALEIDLEFTAPEHRVGNFSLDLIGRDITHDAVLIVENQLEVTDHGHLGQLLTYAAGTSASTIVWVAPQFREEHRQALDWLNESTGDDSRFFGVEITIARIGDSAPAPLFKVVAQPNDWQKYIKTVTDAEKVSGKGVYYVEFWRRFLERLQEQHPDWTRRRTPPRDNWLEMTSPIRWTRIVLGFAAGGRLRHELYIDTGDKARNKAFLRALEESRESIEAKYGRPLEFEELPDRRASKIVEYRDDADAIRTEDYDSYISWLIDCGERLRMAFASLPSRLDELVEGGAPEDLSGGPTQSDPSDLGDVHGTS